MLVLVVGMLLSVGLAVAVVCLVALPARREGRDVLTARGEGVVSSVREKTGAAVETAREKTGAVVGSAREKTGAVVETTRDKVADVTRPNED